MPPSSAPRSTAQPAVLDPLEPRLLLSGNLPSIQKIEADNRGGVVLTADRDLQASTINQNSVKVFTAGADGLLGTADDSLRNRTVLYDTATRQIRVVAEVPADSRYRVLLDASIIRGAGGQRLDGEFNGASTISGDGIEGGNLEFFTKRSIADIIRMTTISGVIDVEMFRDRAPLSVQNFLSYANSAVWDTTFFHRGVNLQSSQTAPSNFVIQGGGFTSTAPFPHIPPNAPVRNEFGTSNTRGTIAMAKLGGDPNSATNEWFFNLADNSSNLDNQNGGFTVFGQITTSAGLSVMDALAAFQRFNASSTNGAFNDLPVVDRAAVQARQGQILASDLVTISRVALLVDVTGEASQQLPTEGSLLFTKEGSTASVRVFDLDGTGFPPMSQFITVKFGGKNSVSSIELKDPFPNVRVGIQVLGASSVGEVRDLRRSGLGDVAFIVSDAAIGTLRTNTRISGYNLNDYVLPGLTFDPDIDGDGFISDNLAVYVGSGFFGSLDARGGLNGDVVARGGLGTAKVGGVATESDFQILASGRPGLATSYAFDQVVDSEVRSVDPIASIRATEWRDKGGRGEVIRAATLGSLTTTGDKGRGINGNFEAGLDLAVSTQGARTLGSAGISGGLLGADWRIDGLTGPITVKGDTSTWTLSTTGDVGAISVGRAAVSSVTTTGRVASVSATEWIGGAINAGALGTFKTRGDKKAGLAGDASADFTITGSATPANKPALAEFKVVGGFHDGRLNSTGSVGPITVNGPVDRLMLQVIDGDLKSLTLGPVTQTDVEVRGVAGAMRTPSWLGGVIRIGTVQSFAVTGDQKAGLAGDFGGSFTANNLKSMSVAHDVIADLRVGEADSIVIGHDLRNSNVTVTRTGLGSTVALRTLKIGGMMQASNVHTRVSVASIETGAMADSGVYVGAAENVFGLPDSGAGFTQGATLTRMVVRGMPASAPSVSNAFIVGAVLGNVTVNQPVLDNLGRQFGVAGGTLGTVTTRLGNISTVVRATDPSFVDGDYQVRVNFVPPVTT